MTDIVERLRYAAEVWDSKLVTQAADEIVRLRNTIRQIELNSRKGEPLTLKLNWLAKQALP